MKLTLAGSGLLLNPLSAEESSILSGSPENGKLPGLSSESLGALRDFHRDSLFDDFLPFMDRYVIDHEYGGFMCQTDRDGTSIDTNKLLWYEGRGIWVYSFLYNHLAREQKYLDVARKSVDLIMKHQPTGDNLWPARFTREGDVLEKPDVRVYGDLFVAEGLAEYSIASGESDYFELALNTIEKCIRIYDRPDYYPHVSKDYLSDKMADYPGARILGVWMVLLRSATQMLRLHPDHPSLNMLADRCIDAIMNYHYNSDFDLLNELINHDLTRPDNEYRQLAYVGHSIETMWMVMDEAVRRRDRQLFEKASRFFRRHVEVAWDDVYGGLFQGLFNVDKCIWDLDKVLWAQQEALIGLLMMHEHAPDDWSTQWFDRIQGYITQRFLLRKYNLPLWAFRTDRKATFEPHASRIENYHHPRWLMLNLITLDRVIKNDGRPSTIFA